MSPEMAQAVVEKLKSGQADQFGVTGINAFVGEKETWCITESDSAESVHKSHQAMGISLGEGAVTQGPGPRLSTGSPSQSKSAGFTHSSLSSLCRPVLPAGLAPLTKETLRRQRCKVSFFRI
jgi:hypothetical protein